MKKSITGVLIGQTNIVLGGRLDTCGLLSEGLYSSQSSKALLNYYHPEWYNQAQQDYQIQLPVEICTQRLTAMPSIS
jgi:hypothetical protein